MYTPARDLAGCTWVEEAVVYIDALLVFLKIVVGVREKVDGFRSLRAVFVEIHNGLLPIFRVMWQ